MEDSSTSNPSMLEVDNYTYWKARMKAYIKPIDEKARYVVLIGWEPSKMILRVQRLLSQKHNGPLRKRSWQMLTQKPYMQYFMELTCISLKGLQNARLLRLLGIFRRLHMKKHPPSSSWRWKCWLRGLSVGFSALSVVFSSMYTCIFSNKLV